MRNDLPGFFTMWNDITPREKTRDQHIRKTGDNKKGSNSYNFSQILLQLPLLQTQLPSLQ